jgi:hypothetical protein
MDVGLRKDRSTQPTSLLYAVVPLSYFTDQILAICYKLTIELP